MPKAKLGFAALAVFGVLALLGWLAVTVNRGLEPLGYGLLAWGGSVVLVPLALAVHEVGHAAAAALLGRRVYKICIGSGAPFRTFRIGHTLLVLGRDMGAGYVVQLAVKEQSRWASLVVLAAGAAANICAAILLLAFADRLYGCSAAAAAFITGSILSNILTAAVALFSGSHIRDGQPRPSDGRQMLQTLRRRPAPVDWQVQHDAFKGEALLQAKRWDEAEAHYRDAFARHPDQPGFLALLLHVLALSKGNEVAVACADEHAAFLRPERPIDKTVDPLWSYAWSMTAWTLIRSPSGNLAAASAFLRKAIEADPGSPYPRAIEGAILTRAGEPAKGLAIILDGMKALGSPGDKLEFCDFIVAEHLESADLKTSDFRSYAAHLRALV